MKHGAQYVGDHRCQFQVWAPLRQQMVLEILSPQPRLVPMAWVDGYWQVTLDNIPPGARYQYQIDGQLTRPDPASHYQSAGVHGASEVVDHGAYVWQDRDWRGVDLADYVIYELHVGTFTPEGTFAAIIPRLPVLKALGITAIELMPVAQFPGTRNWGYDGAYPFAVQQSYGGPAGLKQLVDACHQQGLAVVLDVVYNHFGPEGNYTRDFGPYFTDRYSTPWGAAINFDDAYSDGVRQFMVDNVQHWLETYHIDALRLDAVHAIYDFGAKHILATLQAAAAAVGDRRPFPAYLIAESDLNDVRVIQPPARGGYGISAQWSDDFHHSLHTLLTGERQGYYEDFGHLEQLAKALRQSFVYDWAYSPHRKRYHGSDASHCLPTQFVVCAQNHDQVGNRMLGERLSTLVSFEALKLAAGAVLLSPYLPLLFMGEEYGETNPFLYFVSHGDPDLVQAVRQGRKREFAAFHDRGEPPDAASVETFQRCQLQWERHQQGNSGCLWRFYQTLLGLRRDHPALQRRDRDSVAVDCDPDSGVLWLRRGDGSIGLGALMNFRAETVTHTSAWEGRWQKRLDSADPEWSGPGSVAPDILKPSATVTLAPHSLVLYELTP